jgi:hypothetical protein
MAKIDNRLLLVLAMVLVLMSVMGTYAILSNLYAPIPPPPSRNTGVVGVEILSDTPKSPPVSTSGVVGVVILKPEIS